MNTIKLKLNVAAIDCYIYGGYLFLIRINGDVVYIPMTRIMSKLYALYPEYKSLLIMAFSRNDYFSNSTGQLFLGIPEVFHAMKYAWKNTAEKMDFTLEWEDIEKDATKICEITSPVLDMRMYAMNLFLGCKNGLYKSNLLIGNDNYTIHPEKLKRIFDAKVVGLNAGFGSVIISSGRDGLFNAPIDTNNNISVNERPDADVSYRTGWSSSDILNYEAPSVFEYLENSTQKLQKQVRYSKFDDSGERIKLTNIGTKRYSMAEMISQTKIDPHDILFTFNSSQSSFLYTREGLYVSNLRKGDTPKGIYLSSRKHEIKQNKHTFVDKPVSASVIPAGCVVEFYDKVVVSQGDQTLIIENEPTMRVRSFINSIRYRNIIATVKMNDITLHSLGPLGTYKLISNQKEFHKMQFSSKSPQRYKDELPF